MITRFAKGEEICCANCFIGTENQPSLKVLTTADLLRQRTDGKLRFIYFFLAAVHVRRGPGCAFRAGSEVCFLWNSLPRRERFYASELTIIKKERSAWQSIPKLIQLIQLRNERSRRSKLPNVEAKKLVGVEIYEAMKTLSPIASLSRALMLHFARRSNPILTIALISPEP